MDINGTDNKSDKNKLVSCLKSQNVVFDGDREGDDDSKSLLPHRGGGISRKSEKPRRKVQWNDKNGNKLTEVLEFQPSDASDSDDEDSDSCICTIM
ncbi:uncharacterized protein LOC132274960 [Cornus florida]|uniref:uncharacterized protein LOC132274960 n=1 Tax=Cornus florida TaxID=4283 RepID=UPI00289CA4FF|nr:uncharacterized protein LOC132274960 [Cornus florida]